MWGVTLGRLGGFMLLKHNACRQTKAFAIPSPDPADPADPANPPDLVHGLQLGSSPTRAGGQDDVSLDKLPQNRFCQGICIYV